MTTQDYQAALERANREIIGLRAAFRAQANSVQELLRITEEKDKEIALLKFKPKPVPYAAPLKQGFSPCPFCGNVEVSLDEPDADEHGTKAVLYAARCTYCNARTEWRTTSDKAEQSWNMRAIIQ